MRAIVPEKLKRVTATLLSMLLAFEPVAHAQYEGGTPLPASGAAQHSFSQQELDQMLAPIALYPDPLLSQILMASTYPLEVVGAARWSRANPGLKGDDAVRAVRDMDWDPSVKSLAAFPQILQMMDEKLDWTERLGDAFLGQQTEVTGTIQGLRQKAHAAGYLTSSDQVRVAQEGQIIAVEPVYPDIVYVPYYDPFVVYGAWWWPGYPPVYWAPWPGYYYAPGYGLVWGAGIVIATGFFFGAFDWHHHRVQVVNVNTYYYPRPGHRDRFGRPGAVAGPGIWRHDPDHRRGIPYRDPSLRRQFGRGGASPEAHREYRGYDQSPLGTHREREGSRDAGVLSGRPVTPSGPGIQAGRPEEHGSRLRPGEPALSGRPAPEDRRHRPAPEARPPALEDIDRGGNVRDDSSRGRLSHERRGRGQHGAEQSPDTPPRGGIRPPKRRGE